MRIHIKRIIFYQQKRKNVTFAPLNLSVAQLVEHSDISREGHSKEMRWGNKRNLSVAQLVEHPDLSREGHSKEMRWGNKRNLSVAQLVEHPDLSREGHSKETH